MAVVCEPVLAYLRQHCNSFATMSDDAVFSDTFTLNAVGVMTEDLKRLFLIQVTNRTLCSHCNNTVVCKSSIFVLYLTPLNLLQNQSFENCISATILPNSCRLYCNFCQKDSGDVSMLQHFVLLPTFLIVELSSNCMDQIFFTLTMDVLGQRYVLKGMIRCSSHHFTVAVKDDTRWVYIDDNYVCFS